MRCVVWGASGYLGSSLVEMLGAHMEVLPVGRVPTTIGPIVDMGSIGSTVAFLRKERPDYGINCVGLANLTKCEEDPGAAQYANVVLVRNILSASSEVGCRLIHISTDYVFSTLDHGYYSEDDEPAPIQTYGRTKLEAERIVARQERSLILRLPLLYGHRGNRGNWAREVVQSLRRDEIVCADDTYIRQPLFVDDLVPILTRLIELQLCGLLHVAPQTLMTKFEWTLLAARALVRPPERVVRKLASEETFSRPRRSPLSTTRLRSLDIPIPSEPEEGIRRYVCRT